MASKEIEEMLIDYYGNAAAKDEVLGLIHSARVAELDAVEQLLQDEPEASEQDIIATRRRELEDE